MESDPRKVFFVWAGEADEEEKLRAAKADATIRTIVRLVWIDPAEKAILVHYIQKGLPAVP